MTHARGAALAFPVAALGIAVFSGMDALMKGLALALGTYDALFWRTLAAACLTALPHFARRPGWPGRRAMRLHAERGAVGAVMALLFFWGLARIPMAQAVALSFIAPLIALGLAALLLKERIGRQVLGASLLAFAGVLVILTGQARAPAGPQAIGGALAVLGSAVCYAYNIVLMRRQALLSDPLEVAFFQTLMVSAYLGLAAPVLATLPDGRHLPAILLAAVLGALSLGLLTWAYARAEASRLAASEYSGFLWAALFGWLVFGEAVRPLTLAGAMLIVAGCLLAARSRPPPPPIETEL